jgi:hypothetical protein
MKLMFWNKIVGKNIVSYKQIMNVNVANNIIKAAVFWRATI